MNIINTEKNSEFMIKLTEDCTTGEWRKARSLGTVKNWMGTEIRVEVEGIDSEVLVSPTQLYPYVGLLQNSALTYTTKKTRTNWCYVKQI